MMNGRLTFFAGIFILPVLLNWMTAGDDWTIGQFDGFNIYYTASDKQNITDYYGLIAEGTYTVQSFFEGPFKSEFDVLIHPNRHSLDSTWQNDWVMPDFKSECWMVASGVATRLDMISPKLWIKEACEHDYANLTKT